MSDLQKLTDLVVKFRDDRDWKRFHHPKDSALSLMLEAAEVLEHFQWKTPKDVEAYLQSNKQELAEELADVLYWVLLMVHDLEIDLVRVFEEKMKKNEKKYPIEKAKGRADKYTKL